MNKLLEKLQTEHKLDCDELTHLLENDKIDSELFERADETRKKFVGDEVHLRGLIEFSNICKRNCMYCGLRCDNKNIERYRLSKEQIIQYANIAKNLGYKTVVLQSGEADTYNIENMKQIIKNLKELDLAVTLSLGEKTYEEYKAYKEAGADRYLLRIETTDQQLYKKLHPKMNFDNRIQCLKNLKELRYETGSGFLTGLPNQTLKSIAQDLLFLKEINVDMAGIGPFIPSPNTPLYNKQGGNFMLALKSMALMRLLLPSINIPATTAMEAICKNGQIKALQCGANVIMPNVTAKTYREKYSLYPGKTGTDETAQKTINKVKENLKKINRTISQSYGTSKNYFS